MKHRILIAHNYYQQPGGEDQVFASEAALLEAHGHGVVRFTVHNDQVRWMGRLSLMGATFWNRDVWRRLFEAVRSHGVDVVHFHNTFPLISPAGYSAARAGGAAVVQTLHNFRRLCASPYLYRDGRICESCVGKHLAWPAVAHGCYHASRAATAVAVGATAVHNALGTFRRGVHLYIAPSDFARNKLIEGGLPAQKIAVKPNFVDPDPGVGDGDGGYALFVGRLSPEKGVSVLLDAWGRLGRVCPLKIIGDGELAPVVRQAAEGGRVEWLGTQPPTRVYEVLGRASFLVVPSECYETFGRVIVEAFAKGTPVVASKLGAQADLVEHERSGLLFEPANAGDLVGQVEWLLGNPGQLARMRQAARREFVEKYTGRRNYEQLAGLYERAVEVANRGESRGWQGQATPVNAVGGAG